MASRDVGMNDYDFLLPRYDQQAPEPRTRALHRGGLASNPFEREDERILSLLRGDSLGDVLRNSVMKLATDSRHLRGVKGFCHDLFFKSDVNHDSVVSIEEFKQNILPRLLRIPFSPLQYNRFSPAAGNRAMSEADVGRSLQVLDRDGTGRIQFGDFMNYFTVEDISIRLILMKMRIEIRQFLLHREKYPFLEAYLSLTSQKTRSSLSLSLFEMTIVRKLGISSLSRDQLNSLYLYLKPDGEPELQSTLFTQFLSIQVGDFIGDEKQYVVDVAITHSETEEAPYRTKGYIPTLVDDDSNRQFIPYRSQLSTRKMTIWYLLKSSSDYSTRAEFLQNRLESIRVASNKSNADLLREGYQLLKHGRNVDRTASGSYLYIRFDPLSDNCIIKLEMQQNPARSQLLLSQFFIRCETEAVAKYSEIPIYIWGLHYNMDQQLKLLERPSVPTDLMVLLAVRLISDQIRLSRSILDSMRKSLVESQKRVEESFRQVVPVGNTMKMEEFVALSRGLIRDCDERDFKITYRMILKSDREVISFDELTALIRWAYTSTDKSLENYADRLFYDQFAYRVLVNAFEDADPTGTGDVPLLVFHKLLIANGCMILLEEIEEWLIREHLYLDEKVKYTSFFHIWWEDQNSFKFASRPMANVTLPEGRHFIEISGDKAIQSAFETIVSAWRRRALELGNLKYLDIPKLFLELGGRSEQGIIPVADLNVIPQQNPYFYKMNASNLAILVTKLSGGAGQPMYIQPVPLRLLTSPRSPLTLANLTKLLLYGDNGLESIIHKIRDLVERTNKEEGRDTVQFFRALDSNGDGHLSSDEIRSGLSTLSKGALVLSNEELSLMMTRFDSDHSDSLDMDEFLSIVHPEDLFEKYLLTQRPQMNITDDDLIYEGTLTVSIMKATGVVLRGYGGLTPFVKVCFLPRHEKVFQGETRPSLDCTSADGNYSIRWGRNEDRDVRIKYPGMDISAVGSSCGVELSLYDTDRYKDIFIGRVLIEGSALANALKSGNAIEAELKGSDNTTRVGRVHLILYLIPDRIEQEGLRVDASSRAPGSGALVISKLPSGSIYVTIHKIRGLVTNQVKALCTLHPTEESRSTFAVSQETGDGPKGQHSVLEFKRQHQNVLKFSLPESGLSQLTLTVELVQERKILSNISLGKKTILQSTLEHYLNQNSSFWVPILDSRENIIARVQVSVQFISMADGGDGSGSYAGSAASNQDWNLQEIDKVQPLSFSRFKDLIALSIPLNSSKEIFGTLSKSDVRQTNQVTVRQLCSVLKDYKVELTNEFKATILREFDPRGSGFVDYVLFCALALPNEYLQSIIDGLKASILEASKSGKDFQKAFSSLGFDMQKGIPPDVFITVISSLLSPTPSKRDLLLVYSQFDRDRDGLISYDEFFAFLTSSEGQSATTLSLAKKKIKTMFEADTRHQYKDVLYRSDRNGNGLLSREEFRDLCQEIGLFLSEEEVQCLFQEYDKKRVGQISYERLLDSLLPGYFSQQRDVDDALLRLRLWAEQKNLNYFSLRESLQKISPDDGSQGVPRRVFRLFFTNLNAPIEERDWRYLLDKFTLPSDPGRTDIDRFFKLICGKVAQEKETAEEKEIKESIRQSLGKQPFHFRLLDFLQTYDIDRTHKISVTDLRRLFTDLDIHLSDRQMDALISKFDPSLSGTIAYHPLLDFVELSRDEVDDILQFLQRSFASYVSSPMELFKRFDFDRSGHISIPDMKYALRSLNVSLTDFQFVSFFSSFLDPVLNDCILYPLLLSTVAAPSSTMGNTMSASGVLCNSASTQMLAPGPVPFNSPNGTLRGSMGATTLRGTMNTPHSSTSNLMCMTRGGGLLESTTIGLGASAGVHTSSPGNRAAFEDAIQYYRQTGIYMCPICNFTQKSKFSEQCEMCLSQNPFQFDYDILVLCTNCLYQNPPSNTFCELCRVKLPQGTDTFVPTNVFPLSSTARETKLPESKMTGEESKASLSFHRPQPSIAIPPPYRETSPLRAAAATAALPSPSKAGLTPPLTADPNAAATTAAYPFAPPFPPPGMSFAPPGPYPCPYPYPYYPYAPVPLAPMPYYSYPQMAAAPMGQPPMQWGPAMPPPSATTERQDPFLTQLQRRSVTTERQDPFLTQSQRRSVTGAASGSFNPNESVRSPLRSPTKDWNATDPRMSNSSFYRSLPIR